MMNNLNTEPLTKREHEALRSAALGLTAKEAGEEMGITWQTFKNHLYNARTKLGVSTTLEAVLRCLHEGILTFEDLREGGAKWLPETSRHGEQDG